MNSLQNFRGQAYLESLVSLPVAISGLMLFLVLIWCLIASLLSHHLLYEMLICQEMIPPSLNCQQLTQGKIENLMLFGKLQKLTSQRNPHGAAASAIFLFPAHLTMAVHESLALPLQEAPSAFSVGKTK